MDALTFVANYNADFGKPGLLHTVQVLKEQFANLTAQEKMLFADLQDEIIACANVLQGV